MQHFARFMTLTINDAKFNHSRLLINYGMQVLAIRTFSPFFLQNVIRVTELKPLK